MGLQFHMRLFPSESIVLEVKWMNSAILQNVLSIDKMEAWKIIIKTCE